MGRVINAIQQTITELPRRIADKIAAGEVVDRPVSIVKELVENSIDAGADFITVEIKNGGKSYIRVTDNGCGIKKEYVTVAFKRHATSKISQIQDLDAIETLGFRGEALASIAAVSRVELTTKAADEKLGTEVINRGGDIISANDTGCADGTTVIVRDLFFNTPARLKFLKADNTESALIIDFMTKMTLAYPDIRIRMINNGNTLFTTPGRGDRLAVIATVFDPHIAKKMIKIENKDETTDVLAEDNHTIKIEGYISPPEMTKTNRKSQIFFVNGRYVQSKVIEKAISDGYKQRLFDGRYPLAYIFLDINPSLLDVNIHPNKREVRFDDDSAVYDVVLQAVKSGLKGREALGSIKFKSDLAGSFDTKSKSSRAGGFDAKDKSSRAGDFDAKDKSSRAGDFDAKDKSSRVGGFDTKDKSSRAGGFDAENENSSATSYSAENKALGESLGNLDDSSAYGGGADAPSPFAIKERSSGEQVDIRSILRKKREDERLAQSAGLYEKAYINAENAVNIEHADEEISPYGSKSADGFKSADGSKSADEGIKSSVYKSSDIPENLKFIPHLDRAASRPFDISEIRPMGSIFGTYILGVSDDTFYMIDQHAAHERIFFEKLTKSFYEGTEASQLTMTPIRIDVSHSVKEREEEWLGFLEKSGFDIDEFGPKTYAVKAFPAYMSHKEAEQFLEDFFDSIEDAKSFRSEKTTAKIITRACKSAVKGNTVLSDAEIAALLRELANAENPFSCPHGRPTIIRLKRTEIEALFKR